MDAGASHLQMEANKYRHQCDMALVPVHSNISFALLQDGDDYRWIAHALDALHIIDSQGAEECPGNRDLDVLEEGWPGLELRLATSLAYPYIKLSSRHILARRQQLLSNMVS